MPKTKKKAPEPENVVEEIKEEVAEVVDRLEEKVAEEADKIEKSVEQELHNEIEEVARVENKKIGPKLKLNKKHAVILLAVVLVVLALIPSLYFYNQYQQAKNLLQNPKSQASAQAQTLVDEVGKLMLLPTGEQPKIATVTDVTQLAGQPFFVNAKNGDKVLIYAQAGKAILYRDSINKIINVAPVSATSVGSQSTVNTTPAPTQAPQVQTATVTILNSTQTVGLAKIASTKIQSSLTNITVSRTGDAVGSAYPNTLVIDASGNKSQAALQIANLLGGKVQSSIPDGEATPSSDILVILGSDYK